MAQASERNRNKSNHILIRGFMADCPRGVLDQATMERMYSSFLPEGNTKTFIDQLFRVFDSDGDGSIDFKVCKTS